MNVSENEWDALQDERDKLSALLVAVVAALDQHRIDVKIMDNGLAAYRCVSAIEKAVECS